VAFADAGHGWVVGDRGLILATTDGGQHWMRQSSGVIGPLSGVSFVDASHGWAVGYYTILVTSDGGAHWGRQYGGAAGSLTPALQDVDFVDASHGWAVGGGTVIATADGGVTWNPQYPATFPQVRAVDFVDATHGWMAGFQVLATTNGGWTPAPVTVVTAPLDARTWNQIQSFAFDASTAVTYHRLDSGPWVRGTIVAIGYQQNHADDGVHTVSYYSVDAAGSETPKTITFGIDTTGPLTAAKTAGGTKGQPLALRFRVTDNLSPSASVTLKVRDSRGKLVARVTTTSLTGVWNSQTLTLKKRGAYRFFVYAKDIAHNAQTRVGSAKIVVR
jgi:hypothetical protein